MVSYGLTNCDPDTKFVAGYSGDGIIDTNDVARVSIRLRRSVCQADEPPLAHRSSQRYRMSRRPRLSVNATALTRV